MLNRLPRQVPPLSLMLSDIGGVKPQALAKAMDVSERTARGWIARDEAPIPVLLALFWLTRWGRSSVDAEAHNDAVMQAQLARALGDQVKDLTIRMQRLGRIADFGSANDPAPNVARPAPRPGAVLTSQRQGNGQVGEAPRKTEHASQEARLG